MSTEQDPLTLAAEALARRNFDAECGDTWTFESLPAEVKRGWLSEALKQAKIVAAHFEPRQVTTVEEVAALPVDSVLAGRPLRLDSTVGNIFCVADPEAEEQTGLYVMGVDGVQSFDFIFDDLPATVLHEAVK